MQLIDCCLESHSGSQRWGSLPFRKPSLPLITVVAISAHIGQPESQKKHLLKVRTGCNVLYRIVAVV